MVYWEDISTAKRSYYPPEAEAGRSSERRGGLETEAGHSSSKTE
jgi:hypothetical protein